MVFFIFGMIYKGNMKKIFGYMVPIFLVLLLTLRFVEYSLPASEVPPQLAPCLQPGQTAENFPGVDPGELFSCALLEAIDREYVSEIKPIFQNKCFACHGLVRKIPLYGAIPPVSWLVNHDRKEAQGELDLRYSFPFPHKKGLDPQAALEEILEVVQENSMPPWIYLIMHWNSSLTHEESQKIQNWANGAIQRLGG